MKISKLYIRLTLIGICFVYSDCHLVEFYRWKQVSYEGLPSDKIDRNSSNTYLNVYNIVPRGVSHYNGRLFITVPRIAPGIPSTLNCVPDDLSVGSSPSLRPYPDLKTNELHVSISFPVRHMPFHAYTKRHFVETEPELEADENRIVSVYRTRVDDCGRLWFVDTGHTQEKGKTKQIQQPSVWVIDLNSDEVVRRFEIPNSVSEIGRGMVGLKVDVDRNKCDKAYAYIPDIFQQRLYVYSFASNDMWTFTHPYLNYELKLTNYDVAGFKYQWKDAVFSVTLGRRRIDGYRKAYFHPMASNSEFAVTTKILQNETASRNIDFYRSDFVKLGERGNAMQSSMHDFDEKTGVIFYALVSKNGISCSNPNLPLNPDNHFIIAHSDVTMNYPADLTVDANGSLWAVTNTMPRYILDKLDPNEYNFRVWTGKTNRLIRNTVCASRKIKTARRFKCGGPR